MNKTLLATILAIFLILGIACVCATELQSTSDHGGNYYTALFDGPDFDDGVIDVFDFDIFDFPIDDVFDFDLPDIPFLSD